MKFFTKKNIVTSITGGLVALSFSLLALGGGLTNAIGEGQIDGGDIYRIKNVTKNSAFAAVQTADKCETLQYKVRLNNPGPGTVSSVNVKVALSATASTTNISTVTTNGQNAQPATTTSNATLNTASSQKVTYVAGSTQLLNANNALLTNLPDGITGSGVGIGSVGVGLNEIKFVQFQAKTDCTEPPKPVTITKCEALNVTKVSRTKFDFIAQASVQNAVIQKYTFTTKNAAGAVVDTKVVTTNATSANYSFESTAPGNYTTSTVVTTDKGDVTSDNCVKQFTIEEENTPPPPPVVSKKCESLDVKKVNRTKFDFVAKASVQNAVIQKYTFTTKDKDGKLVSTKVLTTNATEAAYTFENTVAGNYTTTVVITTDKGDAEAGNCVKQITIEEVPLTPIYECKAVTVTALKDRKISVTVTPNVANGAVLKGINYEFGDGNKMVTDKTTVEHTYAKDGDYSLQTTLVFTVNGKDETVLHPNCIAIVSVKTPATPVVLGANQSLPNTGVGSLVGMFAGASTLAGAAHYLFSRRRG